MMTNTTFRSWDELSNLEQLTQLYSDAHKDAYGFRPRGGGVHNPETEAEYEAALEACSAIIEREQREEYAHSLRVQKRFEAEVQSYLDLGAADRSAAVRWWFEANGAEREWLDAPRYHSQDIEHAAYGTLPICLWPFIMPEVIPNYTGY